MFLGEDIVDYYTMVTESSRHQGKKAKEIREHILNSDWMTEDIRQDLFELYLYGIREKKKHHILTDEELLDTLHYKGFVHPTSKDFAKFNLMNLERIWSRYVRFKVLRNYLGARADDNIPKNIEKYKQRLSKYEELMGHKHYFSTRYGSSKEGKRLEGLTRYRLKEVMEKEGLDESLLKEGRLKTLQRDYWFYEVEDVLGLIERSYTEDWMKVFYTRMITFNLPMEEVIISQYQ